MQKVLGDLYIEDAEDGNEIRLVTKNHNFEGEERILLARHLIDVSDKDVPLAFRLSKAEAVALKEVL